MTEEQKGLIYLSLITVGICIVLFVTIRYLIKLKHGEDQSPKVSKGVYVQAIIIVTVLITILWLIQQGYVWASILFSAIVISLKIAATIMLKNND